MREIYGSLILAVLGDSSYVIKQNTTCPQEVGIDRGGFAEVRPLASVTERGCTLCAMLCFGFRSRPVRMLIIAIHKPANPLSPRGQLTGTGICGQQAQAHVAVDLMPSHVAVRVVGLGFQESSGKQTFLVEHFYCVAGNTAVVNGE